MKTLWALCILAWATHCSALSPEVLGGLQVPGLFSPNCDAIDYRPVQVYDAPNGMRIGELVLDNPAFAAQAIPGCSIRPKAHFKAEGQNALLTVQTMAIGAGLLGLAVYDAQRVGGVTWVKGQMYRGVYWVPVRNPVKFLTLEQDLVSGLSVMPETCDELGRCTPVSATQQRLVQQAGADRRDSCYNNAYDITRIVQLGNGRKAYQVQLAPALRAQYGGRLPEEAYVPTYDSRDAWTGFFIAQECARS